MLDLADHAEHFRARVLQDCLTEATAAYWEGRARALADAAPRPDDFAGRATPAELAAATDRCLSAARACRAHAQLLREGRSDQPVSAEARAVLAEVA